ncbi:armadillo-type protein [Crassisporium funariophilum]|nr:armadillo-type protein [Crassisporium funariophilum]
MPMSHDGSRPSGEHVNDFDEILFRRGKRRSEGNKVASGGGQKDGHDAPVGPLHAGKNRWDRKSIQVDQDSPELVDHQVKGLLDKLTMETFDPIADQIIAWANKSAQEQDARTLIRVTRVVFEQATDDAARSEMYARLCSRMMEQISWKVHDDRIKDDMGMPIAGGQLFRKYLLNRCQEELKIYWMAKEATAAKFMEDNAADAANEKTKEAGIEEVPLYTEEYSAAQKAKRQLPGLIEFMGELCKLQMLPERTMYKCVQQLLENVDNPEEEEIESLCTLLATVGGLLDAAKARTHLDVYFSRMKELTKSPNVNSRLQCMLQDLLELREREWQPRDGVAAPHIVAPPPSALATARIIFDIATVQYPEGVSSPRPDLNEGVKDGKFRYDREFLLQFMSVCKKKPAILFPLDAFGLEPVDQASFAMSRGGLGRHRGGSGTAPPSRQDSIGLGIASSEESYQRQNSMPMSRGGSRRGGERGGDFAQVGPNGWAFAGSGSGAPRPPPKAGDLSNFGKISKVTFGPSCVFAGKKGGVEGKRESVSGTNSKSNMFSMLTNVG